MLRMLLLCLVPLGCVSSGADKEVLLVRLRHGQVDRAIAALDQAGLLAIDDLYVLFSGTDQGGPRSSNNGPDPDLLVFEALPATTANACGAIRGLDRGGRPSQVVLSIARAVEHWHWYPPSPPDSFPERRGSWMPFVMAAARQSMPPAAESTLLCFLRHGALESVLAGADEEFRQLVRFQWSWVSPNGDVDPRNEPPMDMLMLSGPTGQVVSARRWMMQQERTDFPDGAVRAILRVEPEGDTPR